MAPGSGRGPAGEPPTWPPGIDAILLGILSGIVPGPYTALVAGKALQRGFTAGARLALVPLATEIPPMAAATLTLTHTDRDVLQWDRRRGRPAVHGPRRPPVPQERRDGGRGLRGGVGGRGIERPHVGGRGHGGTPLPRSVALLVRLGRTAPRAPLSRRWRRLVRGAAGFLLVAGGVLVLP